MNAGDLDYQIFFHFLKKLLKLQKLLNREGLNQNRKVNTLSSEPNPQFPLVPKTISFGEKTISSFPERGLLTIPIGSSLLTSQAEAGVLTSGLPGSSAEAILFSLPTSACQPGIFLVVMWRRACFVRWSLRMKRRSHTGHTNFFSPV